jgi:hypothetical protein
MRHSKKGAMLSGLVFPGAGQIAQKRYVRGMFFVLAVLVAAGAMVVAAVRQASVILDQVMSSGGDIDLAAITDAAMQVSGKTGSSVYGIALLAILVAWIVSVVDAYLTGRRMDASSAPPTDPPPLPSVR